MVMGNPQATRKRLNGKPLKLTKIRNARITEEIQNFQLVP